MKNLAHVDQEDCFDRLPDPILLHIFNKLKDAKSLTRCLSVSKRFSSLISQTQTLFLSLPPSKSTPTKNNLLKTLLYKFIAKPLLHFFHHNIIAPKKSSFADPDHNYDNAVSYYSVLKHFKELKSVHIELPSSHDHGKIGVGVLESSSTGDDDSILLLKWKAKFGGELKSCVVIGATSFQRNISESLSSSSSSLDHNSCETSGQVVLAGNELKLRIVWIISCLIAASARHYLLKQILAEHHRTSTTTLLQNVTISDVNKQGKLCMDKDQIFEMRNSVKETSLVAAVESSLERTQVPNLSMKLWYVPVLELPETGYLMKGATLIVIRPIVDRLVGKGSDNIGDDDLFGFDGKDKYEEMAFDEAVRKMMKMKKSYVLTMNSF